MPEFYVENLQQIKTVTLKQAEEFVPGHVGGLVRSPVDLSEYVAVAHPDVRTTGEYRSAQTMVFPGETTIKELVQSDPEELSPMEQRIWTEMLLGKDPSLAHAGCLFEHSIHDIDLIDYFFSNTTKISKIYAKIRYISSLSQNQLEDVAILNLDFNNGLNGNLVSLWHKVRRDQRRLEIFSENGVIILDGYTGFSFDKFEYQIKRKRKKVDFKNTYKEYFSEINYPEVSTPTGPYFFQHLMFFQSIIKEEKPYPSLEIGLKAHKLIENAYQSSKEGTPIYIQ